MESAAAVARGYRGIGMEGPVAKWYTNLTRSAMPEFRRLAERIARELPAGGRVLEVAPGPGYFAIELAKLGPYEVTGLDISRTFVAIASRNAAGAGVRADFRHGNAAHMPFGEGEFDFLLCRAAFKNFAEPVEALREMHRVLRPGGKALIIDLRKDATAEAIRQEVARMGLSAVNAFLTRQTFRFMLLRRAYTKSDFVAMVAQTAFGSASIAESLTGMEIGLMRKSPL